MDCEEYMAQGDRALEELKEHAKKDDDFHCFDKGLESIKNYVHALNSKLGRKISEVPIGDVSRYVHDLKVPEEYSPKLKMVFHTFGVISGLVDWKGMHPVIVDKSDFVIHVEMLNIDIRDIVKGISDSVNIREAKEALETAKDKLSRGCYDLSLVCLFHSVFFACRELLGDEHTKYSSPEKLIKVSAKRCTAEDAATLDEVIERYSLIVRSLSNVEVLKFTLSYLIPKVKDFIDGVESRNKTIPVQRMKKMSLF